MKRIFGVILFALALFISSCDTTSNPDTQSIKTNPLIGTWVYEDDSHFYLVNFSSTEFQWIYTDLNDWSPVTGEWSGNYTYTDTVIFFEVTEPASKAGYSSGAYKIYDTNKLYCDVPFLSINGKSNPYSKFDIDTWEYIN